jgi:cell division protease FtsH
MSFADDEIRTIIDTCYDETRELLTENRVMLECIKDELLDKEIIEGDFVYDLVRGYVDIE